MVRLETSVAKPENDWVRELLTAIYFHKNKTTPRFGFQRGLLIWHLWNQTKTIYSATPTEMIYFYVYLFISKIKIASGSAAVIDIFTNYRKIINKFENADRYSIAHHIWIELNRFDIKMSLLTRVRRLGCTRWTNLLIWATCTSRCFASIITLRPRTI